MQYKVLMNYSGPAGGSLCNLPEKFSCPLWERRISRTGMKRNGKKKWKKIQHSLYIQAAADEDGKGAQGKRHKTQGKD